MNFEFTVMPHSTRINYITKANLMKKISVSWTHKDKCVTSGKVWNSTMKAISFTTVFVRTSSPTQTAASGGATCSVDLLYNISHPSLWPSRFLTAFYLTHGPLCFSKIFYLTLSNHPLFVSVKVQCCSDDMSLAAVFIFKLFGCNGAK